RAEPHAPLGPAERLLRGERVDCLGYDFGIADNGELRTGGLQSFLDLRLQELWPEEGTAHPVKPCMRAAWLPPVQVIGAERRADRPARIASAGLNPDVLELAVAQHLAVRDAIERDAAGKAQVALACLARKRACHPQHDLFGDSLDRGGDVHMKRRQALLRRSWRLAEQRVESAVGH